MLEFFEKIYLILLTLMFVIFGFSPIVKYELSKDSLDVYVFQKFLIKSITYRDIEYIEAMSIFNYRNTLNNLGIKSFCRFDVLRVPCWFRLKIVVIKVKSGWFKFVILSPWNAEAFKMQILSMLK